jgi:hypothetical protein
MKVLGWVCLFADAGNFIVPQLMPFDRSPFKLPPDYPVLALAVFVVPGPLFFLSARGIAVRASWGRRLGQAAVALLVGRSFFLPAGAGSRGLLGPLPCAGRRACLVRHQLSRTASRC